MHAHDAAALLRQALRYRWLIFWLLALGYVLVKFHQSCTVVVAVDMMRDLQTDGALFGLLSAAYVYPYTLMQIPAGILSDSWGPRKTVTLFFLVACAGSMLLAVAPTAAWAILGETLVGIGVAMLFVPTLKILSHWFDKKEFAAMTGRLVAMGGIGSLIAPISLVKLKDMIGWRPSFLLIGGFTLVVTGLLWVVMRDYPADKGFPPMVPEARKEEKIPLKAVIRKVLADHGFWWLGIWLFFNYSIFFSYSGVWGHSFLVHIYKLKIDERINVLVMMPVGMIAGSFLLGWLAGRVFRKRRPLILLCGAFSLLITVAFTLWVDRLSLPLLYLLTFGIGLGSSASLVIGFTMAKELFPVRMAGTATGLVNFFPFASGALLQPLLGLILEHAGKIHTAGYQRMFLVLTGCALGALVAAFFLRETGKR